MPSLRDLMSDDLVNVILDDEAFAENGSYVCDGLDDAEGFDVVIAVGDPTDQVVQLVGGRGDQQQISGTTRLSTILAGILAATGESRTPVIGDVVVFASGAYAGRWTVLTHQPDQGDGIVLTLRYESRIDASAADVVAQP